MAKRSGVKSEKDYPPLLADQKTPSGLRLFYESIREYQEVTLNLQMYEIWDTVSFYDKLSGHVYIYTYNILENPSALLDIILNA